MSWYHAAMNTISFPTTVSARQIQRDYKSIFAKVNKTNKPVVVISNNEPQVVLISIDKFKKYSQAESKQNLWDTIASIQAKNQDVDPNEVEKDVNAAVKRARMRIYAETFGSTRQQHNRKRNHLPTK